MALARLERGLAGSAPFGSPVPPRCRDRPCAVGVDEAGRGPVLGPMVYAICYCPLEDLETLKELGVADSKTLSEAERERRFALLEGAGAVLGWALQVLPPQHISASMQRRAKCNLNELSHDTDGLVQFAQSGVRVAELVVDTVGPAEPYAAKLRRRFPGVAVTVCPRADSSFAVVSAASICAKVARDLALKQWVFEEDLESIDRDYGSGYPNDPRTKQWLRRSLEPVFGFPRLVRFSLGNGAGAAAGGGVPVTWADEDPEGDPTPPSLLSYFARSPPQGPPQRPPHRFERRLRPLDEL
ncbi:LOW QUALITY PROTEIN: ribonuclease H2 subunit A [Guaruba guarouba]